MRKVTATTHAANAVKAVTGNGWMKFNDKLKDGRRSLKVLGWTIEDYKMAQAILNMAGHEAEIVEFELWSNRGWQWYTQTRLHVKENY